MSKTKNSNNLSVETVISLFTVENGKIKILLEKKKEEPYKGYWALPNKKIEEHESLEEANMKILEKYNLQQMNVEQQHIFSDINRNPNNRVIAISNIGIIDSKTIEIKHEAIETDENWFSINELPKLAFDHNDIISDSFETFKLKLGMTSNLKKLYPSDFTLPELLETYRAILNKKIDRRNFRKKFVLLDLIEETGYKCTGTNGRPAKLYKFKEKIQDINLF